MGKSGWKVRKQHTARGDNTRKSANSARGQHKKIISKQRAGTTLENQQTARGDNMGKSDWKVRKHQTARGDNIRKSANTLEDENKNSHASIFRIIKLGIFENSHVEFASISASIFLNESIGKIRTPEKKTRGAK